MRVAVAGAIRRAATLPLADRLAEAIAILLLIPLTLSVALWNGFPIIFYDTGAYLLEGLGREFLAERSPVYSLFLDYGGAGASLWFIAVIQAAATAFVMVETARAVAPNLGLGAFLGACVALVLLTGLPWYVGQIEPDCFAALAALSIYLLAFYAPTFAGWRCWLLMAIATFSMAVHPSHLLLGGTLVAAACVYRGASIAARSRIWPRVEIARSLACCVLGLCLIVASNFELTGQIFVSRAGPAFIIARLLQDRIVMRLLDDTCPGAHYRLCTFKDALPRTADQWLWGRGSPFRRMGRFTGTGPESTRIIWDTLEHYPLLQARAAVADASRQLVTFKTGDQIEPQEWILSKPLGRFIPDQLGAYLAARQQKGEIDFRPINDLHVPFAWLSLLGLVLALVWAVRRRRKENLLFLGYVVLALTANATICGALSNPHDRYQSRLVWLAPFALVLIAGDRATFALRGWGESGT